MAATLVKRVMLKITADDGDTETKLDLISRKAAELSSKHPDLKIKVDSAAASAKLGVLRRELKDTARDADKVGEGGGFSGLVKGLVPAIGEMSMFQKVMLGLNVATSFAEPLLAGVVVAAGGLAAGFASAGLGMGIFAKVAESAYTKVEAADKANKTLTGGLGQMQSGLKKATSEWNHFVSAASPGVAKVIAQGLGLIPKALSLMKPFLAPVEHALHGIITDLSHGLNSSGFKSFIDTMAKSSGPMITGLAHAIGHIVVGIGGILKAFMPMSHGLVKGLDDITAKFAKWGSTLSGHSGFKSLMETFKTETPLAVKTLKNLGGIIKSVVSDMTGLSGVGNSKSLLQIASPFTALLNVLVKANPALVRVGLYLLAASSGAKKISSAFSGLQAGWQGVQKLGGMITTLATKMGIVSAATEEETVAQTELDGAMDANPIGLIVIAVAALALGIYELWKHSAAFRTFFISAWHDIEHIVGDAVNFIKSHWQLIVGILTGPIGIVTLFIVDHWHQITSGAKNMIGDLTSFFKNLPGKIISALGNLGKLLWNSGVALIKGLIGGIKSMVGALGSAVGGIAHKIAGFFGLSPAIEGPLSGGGAMKIRGQHAVADFAAGMLSQSRAVSVAAMAVAGQASGVMRPAGAGAAAGGGGTVIHLHFDRLIAGDPDAIAKATQQMLLQLKRHNGGAQLGLS